MKQGKGLTTQRKSETFKLSHVSPSYRHASDANSNIKAKRQGCH